MAAIDPPRRRHKIVRWMLLALLTAGLVFCLCQPWMALDLFSSVTARLNETTFVSPDGHYTAAMQAVDTGAAGSYSAVLLRRSNPFSKETPLAVGGWKFFDRARWTGRRVLSVGYGSDRVPDPSWVRRWRDVTIVYVPD